MIKLLKIQYIKDYVLELLFDDGCIKQFDFSELIIFKGAAEPLKDIDFFKKVKIISDGRAFGWDNNYDCCVDWARYFAKDTQAEWEDFNDSTDLKHRMKIAKRTMQQHENSEKV
ncbi:MAG: DUF2442 domain-containing protein [Paludibacter sp.]